MEYTMDQKYQGMKRDISLDGLFGRDRLQEIQNSLADVTGISFQVIDYRGNAYIDYDGSNSMFQDFIDSDVNAEELRAMSPALQSAMIVGLGNRYVTADALGTKTAEYVLVTRHIHMHMQGVLPENTPVTSAFCANVLGMTGMETAEVVSALTDRIHPDVVILIDSLAASCTEHIGCVIQCHDSGIAPGAGVGNFRTMLTRSLLNVPVIAIGVPTVVSAETIVRENGGEPNGERKWNDLIVAPKDVDAVIRDLSRVLSDAINLMLFGNAYPELEKLLR